MTLNKDTQSTDMPSQSKEKEEGSSREIHAVFPIGSNFSNKNIQMYFEQFGYVESVNILMDTTLNRPENSCFIKFRDRTSMLKALDRKQHAMGEKYITVTEYIDKNEKNKNYGPCGRKRREQDVKPQDSDADVSNMHKCLEDGPHTVSVKHADMPSQTKDKEERGNCEIHAVFPFGFNFNKVHIKMYFEQFGEVESVTIPMDTTLNRPENSCFIKFYDRTSMLKALNRKHHMMGEKTFTVTEFIDKNERKNKNY